MANRQRIIISFLLSLLLTISIYTLMFSETAHAQVSSNTLESIVNQTGSSGESAQIDMDGIPQYIFGDLLSDTIFVANYKGDHINGTVTAIDPNTFDVKTMLVGTNPTSIFGNRFFSNLIYVANSGSHISDVNGSVSVIDTINHNVIRTIPVGNTPSSIFSISFYSNLTYVANSGSDTVSVIDVNTYNVTNIHVGQSPSFVFGSPSESDTVFVANTGSNGVAVINSMKKEVVAGVAFNLIPFKSGSIICDTDLGRLDAPISHFLYVTSGSKCTAKPSKGFEFSSWSESLNGNSTRTVSASSGSNWTPMLDFFAIKLDDPASSSPFTSFLDFINVGSDDPAATLTVNRFGNFTAYFRALPSPLPNIGLRYLV